MISIDKAIQWNIAVGNKQGEIDYELEYAMLQEEINEYNQATIENDIIEIMDGWIDILRVCCWTFYKAWFPMWEGFTFEISFDSTPIWEYLKIAWYSSLMSSVIRSLWKRFTAIEIKQARDAVAESNNSKLVDGKAVRDSNGKIMKGKNYKKPDFSFLN